MSVPSPTLAVHVVWDSGCLAATECARALFARLYEDPDDLSTHGLRIAVRLWRGNGKAPPTLPPLHESRRAVVLVLVDERLAIPQSWVDYVHAVLHQKRPGDAVIGVALDEVAVRWRARLTQTNLVRAYEVDPALRLPFVLNRITNALCRLLDTQGRRVRVFISHAKHDGLEITRAIRDFLHSDAGVEDFFDAHDLLPGDLYGEVLRDAAAEYVLLAIRTDSYSSRDWCRTEALVAKRARSPVVVVDALEGVEPRAFPYLGNAPCVRWRAGDSRLALEELLGILLCETLRFRYFPMRVADLSSLYEMDPELLALPIAPELLTALGLREIEGTAVYPDPPLSTEELELVKAVAPDVKTITLTSLIAGQ
jgi:TIR domain